MEPVWENNNRDSSAFVQQWMCLLVMVCVALDLRIPAMAPKEEETEGKEETQKRQQLKHW